MDKYYKNALGEGDEIREGSVNKVSNIPNKASFS